MNQLLQVRVLVQTIDTEKFVDNLSHIVKLLYVQEQPISLSLEMLIEALQGYILNNANDSKEITEQIERVLMLYNALETALGNWEPSRASTLSISLEEALYSLNSILEVQNN